MSRYGNRYCMLAILNALIFVGIASTGTQAQELPEFYGVYAVHNAKLTELKEGEKVPGVFSDCELADSSWPYSKL